MSLVQGQNNKTDEQNNLYLIMLETNVSFLISYSNLLYNNLHTTRTISIPRPLQHCLREKDVSFRVNIENYHATELTIHHNRMLEGTIGCKVFGGYIYK